MFDLSNYIKMNNHISGTYNHNIKPQKIILYKKIILL